MIASFCGNRCRDGGTTGQETAASGRSVGYTTYSRARFGLGIAYIPPPTNLQKEAGYATYHHVSRRENIGEEDIAIQNRSRLRLRDDERKRRNRQKMELSVSRGTARTPLGACSAFNPWALSPGIGHEASHLLSQPPSASIRHRHGRDTRVVLQDQEGYQAPADGEQT